MTGVVLATCADLPDGDEDAPALIRALGRLGVDARTAVWDDPSAAAATDELVVLRSTWDYTHRLPQFLRWVDGLRRVANAGDVVRWNSDKVYLSDLRDAGVPTVATVFAAPGEQLDLPAGEYVVKPSVGAGSRGAGRFTEQDAGAAREHAAALHRAGRTVLVQPYLRDVDTAGETALIYVDGTFSHAANKGPMLPAGYVHPVDGASLYVEESISAHEPTAAELAVGARALALLRARFGADQLYARVDLLPSPDGPVVVELEVTEPSLFLRFGAGAPDTLAAAIAARA